MIEKLKSALKAAGLNEGLADVISITSEDQIEGVINKLKPTQNELDIPKILGSEEFKTYAESVGFKKVIELSKPLQSGHDKGVTDGIKSFQEKYLKTVNGEGEGDDGDDPKKMPEWAKKLSDKIDKFETEKAKGGKLEEAKKLMQESKLPDKLKGKWVERIQLESETSVEDQIKGLEKEVEELGIAPGAQEQGLPIGGPSNGKVSKEEAESIVSEIL